MLPRSAVTAAPAAEGGASVRGVKDPDAGTGTPAITLDHVSVVYGTSRRRFLIAGKRRVPKTAVNDLTLAVAPGTVVALLGPNGSGKTTTLNVIIGLLAPTGGTVSILGMDSRHQKKRIRRRLGVVSQETALYGELTAQANLSYRAALYGLRGRRRRARVTELLRLARLLDERKTQVREFSGGMKRRLAIASALVADPDLLVLDEPTLGVDRQNVDAVYDYIKELRGRGKTVLLTTNVLDEAQRLCDSIFILDHGQLVAEGTPDQLRQAHGGMTLVLQAKAANGNLEPAMQTVREMGSARPEDILLVPQPAAEGGAPRVYTLHMPVPSKEDAAAIIGVFTRWCDVITFDVHRPSLDDVFMSLTGREPRD
jgi:ABC-2 type transport system ATP-binding protein